MQAAAHLYIGEKHFLICTSKVESRPIIAPAGTLTKEEKVEMAERMPRVLWFGKEELACESVFFIG
jgi:hypothetical protein